MESDILILKILDFKSKKDDKEYCRIDFIPVSENFYTSTQNCIGYDCINRVYTGHKKLLFGDKPILQKAKGVFELRKTYGQGLTNEWVLKEVILNGKTISLL